MELFIALLLSETTVGRQAHNKHGAAVTLHAARCTVAAWKLNSRTAWIKIGSLVMEDMRCDL